MYTDEEEWGIYRYKVEIRTTFVPGWWESGETAPVLVLCVVFDEESVSGVVLGVGTFMMACVTVSVLFDLLLTVSTALRLARDERRGGRRICMSFSSSCSSRWRFVLFWKYTTHQQLSTWTIEHESQKEFITHQYLSTRITKEEYNKPRAIDIHFKSIETYY